MATASRRLPHAHPSTPDGCSDHWTTAVKSPSVDRLQTLPYEVAHHLAATRRNGARAIAFHGYRCLATSNGGCAVLTSEAAIEVGAGARVSLLYAHVDVSCNELSSTYAPIAILERDGRDVLVSEDRYEDGSVYSLATRCGRPSDVRDSIGHPTTYFM